MIWAGWLVVVVGSFFALEVPALRNARKGDTLSEQIRMWFHTGNPYGRGVWLVTSGVFFAWFVAHIAH
jgi:hypothetical protein